MRLEVFITDLLYEHDCVVVPGFGGLVANYRPARLNHRTHVIHPPAKHIGFNKNLVANDGLLVHHIAAITGLNYKDALLRVEECVAGFNHALHSEGRLVWEKLGVFFKDKAGQLQFIPEEQENYLLHSFGLNPVQLTPVEVIQTPIDTPVIPIGEARKKSIGIWKVAAAIAIPLLVGGALLVRNEMKSGAGMNFASLNPFKQDTVPAQYQERAASSYQIDSLNSSVNYLNAITADAEVVQPPVVTTTPDIVTTPTPPVKQEEKVVTKPKKETTPTSRKHGFAVIGGAFKVKENATNYLEKLKAQGFEAEIAGTKDGMTLVAYGIYTSRNEAENALSNLRSSDDVRAWIRQQ